MATTYEPISTYTVGSPQASYTMSSIPATYTDLVLIIQATTISANYNLRLNGDTGSNYSWHNLQGDGSSATARNGTNQDQMYGNSAAGGGAPASDFGAMVVDVLDYANTNKYKTIRMLSGVDLNGTVAGYGGIIELMSGSWRNTAAITSITILPSNPNFVEYSSFALYGVK